MEACKAEIEPLAAKVMAIDRCSAGAWLHLDDGRSVHVSSMPNDVFEPLCEAHCAGIRVDYIEMCNMVTGCCRTLAWWGKSGMCVVALPTGEPTEVRCHAE